MGQPLDQKGDFKAAVLAAEVRKETSGAIGVAILFGITAAKGGEAGWTDWTEYDVEVRGTFYVIKRDGTTNERTFRDLVDVLGWGGSFANVDEMVGKPCQVAVGAEEYKGKTQYRVDWLNPLDWEGFGLGNVDQAGVASLDAQFGSKLRALGAGGGMKPATAPAASAPVTPPAAPTAPAPAVPEPGATEPDAPPVASAELHDTKEKAWAFWCDCTSNGSPDVSKWNAAVQKIGKPEDDFSAEDWSAVASEGSPF